VEKSKKLLNDYQGAFQDLEKVNILEPRNVFNLTLRGDAKRMLQDYQGALEDLDKAHFLEPNNAFTLRTRGEVKRMLKDYQGALQDLVEANDLLPNNTFILVILSHVHWHLNNYRLALECLDKVDVNESDDYFIFQYNKKWLKWLLDEYQPIIESLQFNSNVRSFTFDELVTKNDFRKHLGQGLYGIVYEGNWEGKKIAIKVLKGVDGSFNEGAKKSFISEVRTLGSIRHINLVQLLGYCIEGAGHALVYEYMSKSSLDKWLFDDKLNHFLNWHERMHIIIGIAKGLAFLHQCNPIILHLDIKPQNILLDIDNTPKLADFGLARLLDGEQCQVCVTIIYLNLFCNDFVHMGIILCEPYIEKIFFIMPNFNFIK
jgi:tetratricopeptide (TPR) repeat protein